MSRRSKGFPGAAAAGALLGLCLMAASAGAQQGERPVMTSRDQGDTVKINVSGNVVLDYVWRSKEVTTFTNSVAGGGENENTFEGYAAVRVDAELSSKVSAVVEIGTKRVDGSVINEWGNPTAEPIQLREAGVKVNEFLTPALSFRLGIANWAFDVRGRGSAFALDPRHSQSITRNVGLTPTADGPATLAVRAGLPEELEPVGAVFTYVEPTAQQFTLNVVLLPATIEGGPSGDDEALYAVDFWYNLDGVGKGSRLGVVLARHDHAASDGFYTVGAGAVLKGMSEGLELYAEVYTQFGTANRVGGEDIDAGGFGGQVGLEYRLGGDLKPWVGLNLTLLSGDDDTDPTDDEESRFLSYENVNDLAILEDMYLGFDWDTNYIAIKVSGGITLSVAGGKDNLELSAILGFCRTREDVEFASGGEDALGNEIDVRARWILNKQAAITALFAFLTGSDVLEESMGGAANPDSEDNAMLYTLGVDLKF
ncbi:MAG TPA: hypothetical protein VNO22_05945 [Planctomycetota bacterium]|nr:hypothetical protein [Planctomycetota bacterium]